MACAGIRSQQYEIEFDSISSDAVIYLDNHATTPCDQRVAELMLPWLVEFFGNPHSTSHAYGRRARTAMEDAIASIGHSLNVDPDAVLMTSGATESNNLAIDGVCRHPRQRRRHLVTTTIEHPSVLDVALRLERDGFRVTRVAVHPQGHERAGEVDLRALAEAVDEDTGLVSIHWANNEVGVIQPMADIAAIVHSSGALLHSDATQAVGRIPVDLGETDVDLISASAHKFYGPKGIGVLTWGGGAMKRRVRLKPMIVGGGQQRNLRSGTMSPANVIACAAALNFAVEELELTRSTVFELRNTLWQSLQEEIPGIVLNGPEWETPKHLPSDRDPSASATTRRLAGNLNCMLQSVEGEAWMTACQDVAFSSGSACSSVDAKASHVLLGLGLSEGQARRSVRFGMGKFNTANDIERAVDGLVKAHRVIAPVR